MLDLQLWMEEKPMGGHDFPPFHHFRFIMEPQKHCLKPEDAFWTSTAMKSGDGYSSAWVEWVEWEMPKWKSKRGFLYRVKPTAKVLTMNTDEDVLAIHRKFLGKEIPEHLDVIDRKFFVYKHFPWHLIATSYDGIHYCPTQPEEYLLRNWDCESTVWFDMNVLEPLGEVRIP